MVHCPLLLIFLAIPDYKIKWQESQMFCQGRGSSWEFQESVSMKNKLKDALLELYEASGFPAHRKSTSTFGDKTMHPMFMACSGAGTGKSRLLDEFKRLCCDVTASVDESLHNKLKQSFVFKVDMENGTTGSDSFKSSMHYITSRMYHQVIHKLAGT